MRDVALHDPPYTPDEHAPTEDDLLYDEEMPSESERHVLQMYLLRETLTLAWADRPDGYVGIDMFVYFSPTQVLTEDFRGPDVFVATGVPRRERKSWLVWQEGKPPDVVIELLSESTAHFDKVEKKRIYQDRLQVPEYFWYNPFCWGASRLQADRRRVSADGTGCGGTADKRGSEPNPGAPAGGVSGRRGAVASLGHTRGHHPAHGGGVGG